MLYRQCKKGLLAFEGQKKGKKNFDFDGIWTHNLKGKSYWSGALASVATADCWEKNELLT